jgi:hypothetical protein
MSLHDVDRSSLEYICLHLRERDQREIYSLRNHENPIRLAWEAHHMLTTQGRGRIAWEDGKPVAVLGFVESWPGLWDAVAFGTNDFPKVALELMRYGRQEAKSILRDVGGRRLQADAHIDNTDGHKFIQALGGAPEFDLRLYGKDGATYRRFVWFTGQEKTTLNMETSENVLRQVEEEGHAGSAVA